MRNDRTIADIDKEIVMSSIVKIERIELRLANRFSFYLSKRIISTISVSTITRALRDIIIHVDKYLVKHSDYENILRSVRWVFSNYIFMIAESDRLKKQSLLATLNYMLFQQKNAQKIFNADYQASLIVDYAILWLFTVANNLQEY